MGDYLEIFGVDFSGPSLWWTYAIADPNCQQRAFINSKFTERLLIVLMNKIALNNERKHALSVL